MYHIFLIHSSIDGLLGCSHVLAIVNNAAMNIETLSSNCGAIASHSRGAFCQDSVFCYFSFECAVWGWLGKK